MMIQREAKDMAGRLWRVGLTEVVCLQFVPDRWQRNC